MKEAEKQPQRSRTVDTTQPENRNSGGYTELRNSAAMTSAHHIPFASCGTCHHSVGANEVAGFENGLIVKSLAKCSPSRKDEAISAIDFHGEPALRLARSARARNGDK